MVITFANASSSPVWFFLNYLKALCQSGTWFVCQAWFVMVCFHQWCLCPSLDELACQAHLCLICMDVSQHSVNSTEFRYFNTVFADTIIKHVTIFWEDIVSCNQFMTSSVGSMSSDYNLYYTLTVSCAMNTVNYIDYTGHAALANYTTVSGEINFMYDGIWRSINHLLLQFSLL